MRSMSPWFLPGGPDTAVELPHFASPGRVD
jgi:hypothetical protein